MHAIFVIFTTNMDSLITVDACVLLIEGLRDSVVCMYVLSAASSGESFIIPVATDDAGYLSEERRVVWKRPYLSARAAFRGSPCARRGGPKGNQTRDQCFSPIFGQPAGDSFSKQ